MTEKKSDDTPDRMLSHLDRISDALGKIHDNVSSLTSRMDAMEEREKTGEGEKGESKSGEAGGTVADAETAVQLSNLQAMMDSALSMHGLSATPPMVGETPRRYKVRQLRSIQRFSPEWRNVSLHDITDDAVLDAATSRIIADSNAASRCPDVPNYALVERRRKDAASREFIEFATGPGGGPMSSWARAQGLAMPPRRARIRTRSEIAKL